ncbi:zinc finger protein 346 isoform X2 [Corythoichthys intestinalis]|nr:zinc finger protein 346 isoform X2 [Corythoichthys intestinalis]
MIRDHSNLFTDNLCSVCNAVLISESQKLAHYQSKKHGNKVRRYLSIQNEKEPESKKFKSLSSDNNDTDNSISDPMKICDTCKMSFTSAVMANSHYQGKIHAKNLKLKAVDPLTLVQQATPASSKKKAAAAATAEVAAAAITAGNGSEGGDPDRFCAICQASFNNAQMAQQHYLGKKHKKHLAKQDLMKLYGKPATPASTAKGLPCTLCNIELNSVDQYQSHISGAKHKNQMKKSGLSQSDNQQPSGPENKQTDGDKQSARNKNQESGNGMVEGKDAREHFAPTDDTFVTEGFEADDNFFGMGGDIFPSSEDKFNMDS